MPESFAIHLHQAETASILEAVFTTMLKMHVERCEAPWPPESEILTGAVFFTGAWRGATLVECPPTVACRLAARLMGIEEPANINDDVLDSLGEMANMVGGNLKALLPAGVDISLPSVVRGVDYALRICRGSFATQLAFQSEAGVFWISLLETQN
jgi:CheY-specific phosphatase CheX